MALRFVLPEKFGFDAGDSHPLHLLLECFNSVDGSTRPVFHDELVPAGMQQWTGRESNRARVKR